MSFWLNTLRALSLSTIVLTSCVLTQSANAAFYRIDDTGDDGIVNGTCNLREAIQAASSNAAVDACPAGSSTNLDRIELPAGIYSLNLSAEGSDLDVTGSLLIRGTSPKFTTIEPAGPGASDRIFDLSNSASVTIEDLAIVGGHTLNGNGGNIRIGTNTDLTLRNVEIRDGEASNGGGIFSTGDLSIFGGRISGNEANDPGAGKGGGISSSGGSFSLTDVEISGNTAIGDGGGIHSDNAEGINFIYSRITDNTAGGSGGGLNRIGINSQIEWTEFSGNQATIGGGMHIDGMGETTNSAFLENIATLHGGGIAAEDNVIVRFSTISGNSAPLGAGIHAASVMTLLDANTIARNQGEGVHNVTGAFFENTIVAENTGANCAGAAPAFGAFNLEDTNTCAFVSSVDLPNFPNTAPLLGPLQDNGGPTRSIAPLPGSPAIDAVTSEIRMNCEQMIDQRGYSRGRPRTQNGAGDDVYLCDIGAVEATSSFVVDTLADGIDADLTDDLCATVGGTCSLRAAVQQANQFPGRFVVDLGPGTHTLSIPGADEDDAASGDIDVRRRVVIRGAGTDLTIIDGAQLDRIFEFGSALSCPVFTPGPSRLENLTVRGGNVPSGNGGGFFAHHDVRLEQVRLTQNDAFRGSGAAGPFTAFGPRLEMFDSTVDGNTQGMALYFRKALIERSTITNNTSVNTNGAAGEFVQLLLRNSTVSGNTADSTGAFFSDQAIVEDSAIVDNTSDFAPGGPFILSFSVIRNSIIANNRTGGVLNNCAMNSDASTSLGFNITDGPGTDCQLDDPSDLLNTDPLLGSLADNGGFTDTHLLLAGSPAIDMGDAAFCPDEDQRGIPRPLDGDQNGSSVCDIGPVEVPEPGILLGLAGGGLLLAKFARRRERRTTRSEFQR